MAGRQRKVTFEKISETEQGIQWHVEAIHATTTRNKRKYTKEELILAARSLSYRPININHDESRWLSYDFSNPLSESSNCSMIMEWDAEKNGVAGDYWITDKETNERIEAGDIKTVSIEQVPSKGESCSCLVNDCTCEQLGIVFTGTGFLETFKGVEPGDPNAAIKKKEVDYKKVEAVVDKPLKECGCSSPKPQEQNKGEVPEATIDQITNDVLDDMAKKIQAQYDLVKALELKAQLTPADQACAEELQQAKWSLFYMVMDYMKLKKGEEKAPQPDPKETEARIERMFYEELERQANKLTAEVV